MNIAMRTLHAVENDGITPQLFSLLAKERKGGDMCTAPVCIPPTLVFERGFVRMMFTTELSRIDGDRMVPIDTEDLPRRYLNMHTAAAAGYRLEVKKKNGRDVIIKEVYEDFVQGAKDNDIVATLMICQYKDRDDYSAFKYLDKEGLYTFLMQTVERPRAMLQKFVPPKGANNTLIFAIWSPLVMVAEGRRTVHTLTDPACTPNDRGVTFETDDVRLVSDLALPRIVIDEITTTCSAIKTHVEQAERGLTMTRLACYFKIDCHSTLHLVAGTSVRLQRVQRHEIRAPLDLSCGAHSPARDRNGELTKIQEQLDACEMKQQSLHHEMARGLPGAGGTIMEEARKVVKPLHSNRSNTPGNGGDESVETAAASSTSKSHRSSVSPQFHHHNSNFIQQGPAKSVRASRMLRSAAVLPGGETFPSPSTTQSQDRSWNRHRAAISNQQQQDGFESHDKMKALAAASSSSTPPPHSSKKPPSSSLNSILSGIHKKASSGGGKQQQQRQNAYPSSKTPEPASSSSSSATRSNIVSVGNQQQQHPSFPNEQNKPPLSITTSGSSTKPPLPTSADNKKKREVTTTSNTQQQQQKPSSAKSHTSAISTSSSSPSSRSYAKNNNTSTSSSMRTKTIKPTNVHIGSSVDSNLVLETFSSVPRAQHTTPFSSVFTRRLQQEERVSHSWHSFLKKQRQELQNIVSASPVGFSSPGGGGGGNINMMGGGFDASGGNQGGNSDSLAAILGANQSVAGMHHALNESGAPYRNKTTSDPYPAGDFTIDFDNVTKRMQRHKDQDAATSGNENVKGRYVIGVQQQQSSAAAASSHHHRHAGGSGSALSATAFMDETLYSRSLRESQKLYLSPERTAAIAFKKTKASSTNIFSSSSKSPSTTKNQEEHQKQQEQPQQQESTQNELEQQQETQSNSGESQRSRSETPPRPTPLFGGGGVQQQQQQQNKNGVDNKTEEKADNKQETTTTTTNGSGGRHLGGAFNPEEVPQLIDESMLPGIPAQHGADASSVPIPSTVPKSSTENVVMPKVFNMMSREEQQKYQQQQKRSGGGGGGSPTKKNKNDTSSSSFDTSSISPQAQRQNENQNKQQELLSNMPVNEAHQRFWSLKKTHPELPQDELTKLKNHVGESHVQSCQEFFSELRNFIRRIRMKCREAFSIFQQQQEEEKRDEVSVYVEIPLNAYRCSITLEDFAALFSPLSVKICSRGEALATKYFSEEEEENQENNNNISSSTSTKRSWSELKQKRIEAILPLVDSSEEKMKDLFDFPLTENAATTDFFNVPKTCLIITLKKEDFFPSQSNKKIIPVSEIRHIISEDDVECDTASGVDYLLNEETGSVFYVTLKHLPIILNASQRIDKN